MDSANPVTGQQGRPGVPSAPAEVWRGTFALPVAPAVAPPRPPRDRIWFRQTAANLLRAPDDLGAGQSGRRGPQAG